MKLVYQVMYVRRTALALLLALVVVISVDDISRILHLNLAHVKLARWAFTPEQAEPEQHLSAAMRWGESAGAAWVERYGHGERAQMLWEHVANDTLLAKRQAERSYRQGQILEREGQLELALGNYQQAFNDDERWIGAGYQVYQLATQIGQSILAQRQIQVLLTLMPEYPVTTVLPDSTRLLGYDLDEMSLERDVDSIPITLYWELPTPSKNVTRWQDDGWTYIGIQNRMYQIGLINNLLPNGGFERDLSTMAVVPYGYQDSQDSLLRNSYEYPTYLWERHRLALDEYGRNESLVAIVVNVTEELNGLTTLYPIVIKPSELYIIGGWIRVVDGGRGFLGGIWRDGLHTDFLYWYAAQEQPKQSWHYFVSAMVAPKSARTFNPLFLNNGRGEVCFDDVILFQIPIPPVAAFGTRSLPDL